MILDGTVHARWEEQVLALEDAVALIMSTYTYRFYDTLVPHALSVIAVHPPHSI